MSGVEIVLAVWGAIASAFAIHFYTMFVKATALIEAAKIAFYKVATDDEVRDHARKAFLKGEL